jgi:hypothetical protein
MTEDKATPKPVGCVGCPICSGTVTILRLDQSVDLSQETVELLARAGWEAKWIGVTDASDSKSPIRG